MRDDLKDRMVGLMKEAWAQGYKDGVHATNVDCGVVWEERIDAIKEEIKSELLEELWHDKDYEDECAYNEGLLKAISIIDKHCGGE